MFGLRSDGRRLGRDVDPIILFTPYIMPTRNDAQVFIETQLDYQSMSAYIRKNKGAEHPISFMTILAAGYIHAATRYPEMNRFIVNKRLYQRNELIVSFTAIRQDEKGNIVEELVKLHLDPKDTIFDVARKMDEKVKEARTATSSTAAVSFARMALSLPLLPNLIVGAARLMDRWGILPRPILEISPFHCGLFITNMASLGMPPVYHHLYNFGNVSIFLAIGKPERSSQPGLSSGSRRNIVPVKFVVDERCASGAEYARAFQYMQSLINNPEALEHPYGEEPPKGEETEEEKTSA